MKDGIHPKYDTVEVTCGCGNKFSTRATANTLKVDICNVCHPFYTGKMKHIDREGRVYVAFADGCTGSCAEGNNSTSEDSRDRLGSVYFLSSGPSLFEEIGDLAEFE